VFGPGESLCEMKAWDDPAKGEQGSWWAVHKQSVPVLHGYVVKCIQGRPGF